MNTITAILPIVISLVALIVSFMNYMNDRNKVISGVVSTDRMKWISDVRSLMFDFLELYIKGAENDKLKIIKSKIDLYIIYEKDSYKNFEEKLKYCISNPYTDEDYRELVSETQIMLNKVWVRIKDETGISKRDEKRINKLLNKR